MTPTEWEELFKEEEDEDDYEDDGQPSWEQEGKTLEKSTQTSINSNLIGV